MALQNKANDKNQRIFVKFHACVEKTIHNRCFMISIYSVEKSPFSTLIQLGGRQEGHTGFKNLGVVLLVVTI